jgi:hypothetical protein
MHIAGIGSVTLTNLLAMQARGGWMDSADWFALCRANRTPFLFFAQVLEPFSYCPLDCRQKRTGYRLTEKGRAYLAGRVAGG